MTIFDFALSILENPVPLLVGITIFPSVVFFSATLCRRSREAAEERARQQAAAAKAEAKRRAEAERAAKAEQTAKERAARAAAKAATEAAKAEQAAKERAELMQSLDRLMSAVQASQASGQPLPAETAQEIDRAAKQVKAAAPRPKGIFTGQAVAFTGTIPGMIRADAAKAVEDRGGRAYMRGLPVGTTLLVVGSLRNDGNSSTLDKAAERIGQLRKITAEQFLTMIAN